MLERLQAMGKSDMDKNFIVPLFALVKAVKNNGP
jgi:hypothetical protein